MDIGSSSEEYHIWSYADIMCWSLDTDVTVDREDVEDPLHNLIILDLIRSNDNISDHNIDSRYLRITACTADIISLYHIHNPLQLGNCNVFLHGITLMAIFCNKTIT